MPAVANEYNDWCDHQFKRDLLRAPDFSSDLCAALLSLSAVAADPVNLEGCGASARRSRRSNPRRSHFVYGKSDVKLISGKAANTLS